MVPRVGGPEAVGQFFKDAMFDAQFLRILGLTFSGGADIGECLALARRIRDGDTDAWYEGWTRLAERIHDAGQASFVAGRMASAREAFFRAAMYFRASYSFLLQPPLDPRAVRAYERQEETFARAMALMPVPGMALNIPFADTPLRGLFFAPDDTGARRRTLVINNGYDGTAEEMFLMSGPAALARGYNVLVFDGPGQGRALMKQAIPLRPDWETVIQAVLDALIARPDVDPARLVLMGCSLGGLLAARAASYEPRLAALVADPGQFSILEEARAHMPDALVRQLPNGNRLVLAVFGRMLARKALHPTGGWALRRGMLVHGCDSPLAYLKDAARYTVQGCVGEIACPTLICTTEGDGAGRSARQVFDRLACEKRFHVFTAAEGADAHCEAGARSVFNREAFDWLDAILERA